MDKECKNHKWIPLLGVDKGKTVSTSLYTCLKCGDLKVGERTIKISKNRMDMGELPIYQIQEMRLMNPPTANNTASGLVVTATVDSNVSLVGTPLFMASDGHLEATDADSGSSSPCVALALETGSGSKRVLVHGVLKTNNWNWTMGNGTANLIYVSTTTGALTQSGQPDFPSGTDSVIQPVGWALASDCAYFSPSMIYLTHT